MKYLKVVLINLILLFYLTGCDNSTDSNDTGSVSMSTLYTDDQGLPKKAGSLVDSIHISDVKILFRDVKFKSTSSSTVNYKTEPFIINFDVLGNIKTMDAVEIPYGTYNRVEYKIHKIEASDTTTMDPQRRAQFREFFSENESYSIVITGSIYSQGLSTVFYYKSMINLPVKIDLENPLIIDDSNPTANITLRISSYGWFLDGLLLLDPRVEQNSVKIDQNIRGSIKLYRDNNKDGIKD